MKYKWWRYGIGASCAVNRTTDDTCEYWNEGKWHPWHLPEPELVRASRLHCRLMGAPVDE